MVAIYDWFGYETPIENRYSLIKKAGFDSVLLWWSEDFGRGDYHKAPILARKAGLLIENIHTPIQNQNNLWLDNLEGQYSFDCYLQCIVDCADFEIPVMVVHLPEDYYPCSLLGLNRMKKLAQKAEQLGIYVALENVRNLSNVSYVLSHIDSPHIGFCFDSCHHHNYNPNVDLLSLYGSRLMALHLHDNGGIHNQHQLPFDGEIDWYATMKSIARTGYLGPTALEPMNWDYTNLSIEEFLNRAFQKAKALELLRQSNFKLIKENQNAIS